MTVSQPAPFAGIPASAAASAPAGATREPGAQGGFAATLAGAMGPERSSAKPAARQEPSARPAGGESPEAAEAERTTELAIRAVTSEQGSGEGGAKGESNEMNAEAAAALAAAAAAPAPDPSRRVASLNGLDPEFRARLQRVVTRMEREFGHDVQVLETVRSQERQEHLYAQGRTRPGPVVTWTLNSNHRTGRAADLLIDGKWNNPEGYRRLAQIAAEEGLRTLGSRDPGHIELPRGAGGTPTRFAAATLPADAALSNTLASGLAAAGQAERRGAAERSAGAGPGGIARVADVARVASVARVAEVARVATPGRAATGRGGGSGSAGEGDSRGQPGMVDPAFARAEAFASLLGGTSGEASGVQGTDLVGRLARILEMKDAGGASQLGNIVLRMDNGSGGEDRIRVAMRGGALGASIEPGTGTDTERLLRQLPELQRTLERQGINAEGVTVRPAARTVEAAAETVRLALDATPEAARSSGSRSGGDGMPEGRQSRSFADHEHPRRRQGDSGRDDPDPKDQERKS